MGMAKGLGRGALLLGVLLLTPACGGSKRPGLEEGANGLASLTLNAAGGRASGSSSFGTAFGGSGGTVQVFASADIAIGLHPPPIPPVGDPPPTSGTMITDLSVDQTVAFGNALVTATLVAGEDVIRHLTCLEGDLVVSGTILSGVGPLAGVKTTLALSAPNGTIFITGTIRSIGASGFAGGGGAGGQVTLSARKIVVSGLLDTSGEVGTSAGGGVGGALTLDTASVPGGSDVILTGTLRAAGGDSTGGNGGNGAAITINSANDVWISGSVIAHGGSSSVPTDGPTGGIGSTLQTTAAGSVYVNAQVDLKGGSATSLGTGAHGGSGGLLGLVSGPSATTACFGSVDVSGGDASAARADLALPADMITGGSQGHIQIQNGAQVNLGVADFNLKGGDSSDVAGQGGSLDVECTTSGDLLFTGTVNASSGTAANVGNRGGLIQLATNASGDVQVSGDFQALGGDGSLGPGDGGSIGIGCGPSGGSARILGTFNVSGGSSTSTGDVPGGGGGSFVAVTPHTSGSIILEPGSVLNAGGGVGTGAGVGGVGGSLFFTTRDRGISLSGTISARGGISRGIASGGVGGTLIANSDQNNDGVGGEIVLGAGALIDVSGGSGASGAPPAGSVQFLADGNNLNSPTNGVVLNLGLIVARGGSPNGIGGAVTFNGLKVDGITVGPDPGALDLSGSGTGTAGAFTSQ